MNSLRRAGVSCLEHDERERGEDDKRHQSDVTFQRLSPITAILRLRNRHSTDCVAHDSLGVFPRCGGGPLFGIKSHQRNALAFRSDLVGFEDEWWWSVVGLDVQAPRSRPFFAVEGYQFRRGGSERALADRRRVHSRRRRRHRSARRYQEGSTGGRPNLG